MDVRYSRRAIGIALGLFGVMALVSALAHEHSHDASAPPLEGMSGGIAP